MVWQNLTVAVQQANARLLFGASNTCDAGLYQARQIFHSLALGHRCGEQQLIVIAAGKHQLASLLNRQFST